MKRMQKKIALLGAMLISIGMLVLPVHAAESKYNVTEMSAEGVITAETLNVRSGPGKEYKELGSVKKDDAVTITGQADTGWYRIDFKNQEGYVSDKYVEIKITDTEEKDTADENGEEQAETDNGQAKPGFQLDFSSRIVRAGIVGIAILIIVIMLFFTLKGIRKSGEEDEYEDDEDDDDEDDDEDDEEDDDEEEVVEEVVVKPVRKKKTVKKAPTPVVIREEDYQLHIDPIYFEEDKPAAKSEKVETTEKADSVDPKEQEKLDEAMAKLNELQKEIERLKKEKSE